MAKILVVDDNEPLRTMLQKTLERAGHEVIVAKDGAEALRLFKASPADVVITDLIMPEVEGLQLLRTLHSRPNPPKIIAISGGGHINATDSLEMATFLGAEMTIEKPFLPEKLVEAVAKVLGTA